MTSHPDSFRILISTDNHLGFSEKDPIRGNDSFTTFEEILSHGKRLKVDMILIAGDLFHDNRPSRDTLFQCMSLLKKYCFGDHISKNTFISLLSDPKIHFDENDQVNFLNPNHKHHIDIPVFAIHGNHDDPSGSNNLCSLDLLHVTGLLNYFGKVKDVDDVQLAPILFAKGITKLALYGLGSIRDERLHRSYQRGKVSIVKPSQISSNFVDDEYFRVLLFHQNRVSHTPTNFIPEHFIDDYINLIVWGHEHECILDPQYNPRQRFHVIQPGSSVATSLSEGESKQKHIALLTINGRDYQIEKIPLHTVRPFILKDISLSSFPNLLHMDLKEINSFLVNQIESMLISTNYNHILPLIRLRVDYSGGYMTLNPHRFGQQFVDRVANPKDILLFYRKKNSVSHKTVESNKIQDDIEERNDNEHGSITRVEQLVNELLTKSRLSFFPENEFTDSIQKFVEKDDKDALEKFIQQSLIRIRSRLITCLTSNMINQPILDQYIVEEIAKDKQSSETRHNMAKSCENFSKNSLEYDAGKENRILLASDDASMSIEKSKRKKIDNEFIFDDDIEPTPPPPKSCDYSKRIKRK